MKSYVMGIDFGSTTAKTVILNLKSEMVASCVAHMGAVSGEGVKASVEGALQEARLSQNDMGRTVSTGYGRRMLDMADKNYTEITCHARGAVAMVPEARLIIDIGGQDSKTIAVDAKGLVTQFAMNDRCAAGTGKFLEVLARALSIDLDLMGETALDARHELRISSMCATFAETEVISLLAEGRTKPDVLGAVHAAIATRTAGLVARVGQQGPVVMTGGVARNRAAVHYIEKAIGMPVILPAAPQIAGALGAALIGLDDYLAECRRQDASIEDDEPLDRQMTLSQASCVPGCKGTQAALATAVEPRPVGDIWQRIHAHI